MKNIHILPASSPSRLIKDIWKNTFSLVENFNTNHIDFKAQHLYITSDEEIGTDEYYFHLKNNEYYNSGRIEEFDKDMKFWRKIILTTDQDLIKDGVQAIDDEFLEWFVKNPSCEEVDVWINKFYGNKKEMLFNVYGKYKIIIPKEEPKVQLTQSEFKNAFFGKEEPKQDKIMERFIANAKQETLEEAAEKVYTTELVMDVDISGDLQSAFINGAKWQQERSYSEENVFQFFEKYREDFSIHRNIQVLDSQFKEWFEQFKKK